MGAGCHSWSCSGEGIIDVTLWWGLTCIKKGVTCYVWQGWQTSERVWYAVSWLCLVMDCHSWDVIVCAEHCKERSGYSQINGSRTKEMRFVPYYYSKLIMKIWISSNVNSETLAVRFYSCGYMVDTTLVWTGQHNKTFFGFGIFGTFLHLNYLIDRIRLLLIKGQGSLHRLQMVQNAAAWLITGAQAH